MNNKTFKPGPNPHLNAVVGKSWVFDRSHAYATGFDQAVEVLLAAAINESFIDPETGNPSAVYIDAIVYPICFCARHFIELFLKRQIARLSTLRGGQYENAAGTHNLADLWERLTKYVPLDRRLPPRIEQLREVVADFAAIDGTGETFRYAFDLDNNTHLSENSYINIEVLSDRLKTLRQHAEEFDVLVDYLIEEYRQRSYTSKLSRAEVARLAQLLPPFASWETGALKQAKLGILKEFDISSNDFAKALNVIKTHREFSSYIGVEIPLEGITIELIDHLKLISEGHAEHQAVTAAQWAGLAAISDVGRIDAFSESYDFLSVLYTQDDYEGRIYPTDVLREIMARHNRFRVGLEKLGQTSLLSKFDEAFPEPPPEPEISAKEQIARFIETRNSIKRASEVQEAQSSDLTPES